jgi:acetyl-CoA acetyltransferase family protein
VSQSYIVDAVRTPLGRIGGALSGVRPDDLAANVIARLLERSPLDRELIGDVFFGNANGAGEENRNVARMALLLAGVPVTVPGVSVNRLCGSGLEAVVQASRSLMVDDADIVVAGGVESMTRAPWVLPKPDRAFARENVTMFSTALGWRMVNPKMDAQWTVSLGEGAEILADEFAITRDQQDEFALASHLKAAQAWEKRVFDDEIVDVAQVDLAVDECVRADATLASLQRLRPVFRSEGTVTAGNSSPMNDGASALLMMNERGIEMTGAQPLARIASRAHSALEPQRYGLGPVIASSLALERAGITWSDLSVVEMNEAFAAQALACLKNLPALDPAIINPNGGAIAIGHPIGASGARILTTLVHELRRRGARWGLATMCIGVGQGIAVVLDAS